MTNKNENLTELGKMQRDQKHFKKFRNKITSTEKAYYEAKEAYYEAKEAYYEAKEAYYEAEKVYIEAKKAYSEARQDFNTEHNRYFLELNTKAYFNSIKNNEK